MQAMQPSLLSLLRDSQCFNQAVCEKSQRRLFSYGFCLFDVPIHYAPLAVMGRQAVEARDERSGGHVRIQRDDLQDLRATVQELGLLCHFRNPVHVVRLADLAVVTHNDTPHLLKVFERVEYSLTELHAVLGPERLASDVMPPLMHQLLLGLAYVHRQGVVLGCLEPACVYLTTQLSAGLVAGDSSAQAVQEAVARSQVRIGDAQRYIVVGQPPYREEAVGAYAAPEVILDSRCTTSADVFSAGCIMYEYLGTSGEPAFPPYLMRQERVMYIVRRNPDTNPEVGWPQMAEVWGWHQREVQLQVYSKVFSAEVHFTGREFAPFALFAMAACIIAPLFSICKGNRQTIGRCYFRFKSPPPLVAQKRPGLSFSFGIRWLLSDSLFGSTVHPSLQTGRAATTFPRGAARLPLSNGGRIEPWVPAREIAP